MKWNASKLAGVMAALMTAGGVAQAANVRCHFYGGGEFKVNTETGEFSDSQKNLTASVSKEDTYYQFEYSYNDWSVTIKIDRESLRFTKRAEKDGQRTKDADGSCEVVGAPKI